MRLDARTGHYTRTVVWHVEQCRKLKKVVWIDDDINQWAEYTGKLTSVGEMELVTYQAKKIAIRVDLLLVLINPFDDALEVEAELLLEAVDGAH